MLAGSPWKETATVKRKKKEVDGKSSIVMKIALVVKRLLQKQLDANITNL